MLSTDSTNSLGRVIRLWGPDGNIIRPSAIERFDVASCLLDEVSSDHPSQTILGRNIGLSIMMVLHAGFAHSLL